MKYSFYTEYMYFYEVVIWNHMYIYHMSITIKYHLKSQVSIKSHVSI